MNNTGKKSNKKINESYSAKKVDRHKISPVKKKTISSKNIFPQDTTFTINKNNNIKINEENVIANILKTNNDEHKYPLDEKEKINHKIKYFKKTSSTSITIDNDYKEIGDFSFINVSQKVKPFIYKPKKTQEYSSHAFNNFNFLDIANTYRMIINIIVDDDSFHSSNDLLKIFESIFLSLNSLGEINITNKDFLVCIFFQHFSSEETFKDIFPGLNFYSSRNWNIKMNTFYCSYGEVLSVNDTPINVLLFYKESSTFIEIYKFFYCNILNDLISLISVDPQEIGKTFLLVNWPNGKIYEKSSNKYHKSRILSNIFRICNNRNMILIPDINYNPYNKKDYFGYLLKYNLDSDKVNVDLLWDIMCEYPIDHRFFYVNMNFKLYSIIKDYYQNNIINIYSSVYYHDYNFSIYLKKKTKNIKIQKIQQVKIEYNDIPSNLITFFFDFSLKRGSEYANYFGLISYFFSCNNLTISKFFQKFVIYFKIISFIIEFFWLGLSLLISYAVFNECFRGDKNNIDYFCSFGYAIIEILLLLVSTIFIKNKPRIKLNKINRNLKGNKDSYIILLILYIIHYAYNIFFIVSAIIAIIHIDQEKNDEENNENYTFKKNYFSLLLIIILLFYILPIFIRPSNLTSKGFLYYLIFQLLNSACFFHIPYLFTCIRNINSKKKNIESLYISIYLLLNGLLTIICLVFDTKRQRRIDFFYAISIILAFLSGIKLIFLVIGMCFQNRFNKKISTGQIPQYNIVNSENDKNLNDNYTNYINNNNKIDNFNKNESQYAIKYFNDFQKDNEINIYNSEFKIRNKLEKEYSSQLNIVPKNSLGLNQSEERENNKDEIKSQKSIKFSKKNLKLEEVKDNQITNNNKNNLNNEFNIHTNENEEQQMDKEFALDNQIIEKINNNNFKKLEYPYTSKKNNNEFGNYFDNNCNYSYNNDEFNYGYSSNYNMEINNNSQSQPQMFSLEQNDINNENNFNNKNENINNNSQSQPQIIDLDQNDIYNENNFNNKNENINNNSQSQPQMFALDQNDIYNENNSINKIANINNNSQSQPQMFALDQNDIYNESNSINKIENININDGTNL